MPTYLHANSTQHLDVTYSSRDHTWRVATLDTIASSSTVSALTIFAVRAETQFAAAGASSGRSALISPGEKDGLTG